MFFCLMMSDYDRFADTFARSRDHMHWSEIDSIMDSIIDRHGATDMLRIADVGCGNGRFLQQLALDDRFGEVRVDYT